MFDKCKVIHAVIIHAVIQDVILIVIVLMFYILYNVNLGMVILHILAKL